MTTTADVRSSSELAVAFGGVVGAMLLPSFLWSALFVGSTVVIPMAVGVAIALLCAFAARRLGMSWPIATVSFGVLLLVALAGWFTGDVGSLATALGSSWKAVASTGLLLPVSPELAMVPLLVSALSAWVAFAALLRAWPTALGVVAMTAPTAIALVYATSQAAVGPAYAATLAALVTVVLLAIRPRTRAVEASALSIVRSVGLQGLALVVAAAILAGGLTSLVSNRLGDPFDLRERVIRPVDLASGATPVAQVRSGLLTTTEPIGVFNITLDNLPPGIEIAYLPVVTLDEYDGNLLSTGDRFEPAGSVLARPREQAATIEADVQQTLVVNEAYPFDFLPRIGEITEVGSGTFVWDADSGVLARTDREQVSFAFRTRPFDPDPGPPADDDVVRSATASARPELSYTQRQALQAYLAEVVTDDDRTLAQRLAKIEADLRNARFGYNPDAPAGHSLPILICYLRPSACNAGATADRPIGYAEQSATAFALLARQLGASARVVVGYRLTEPLTADAPSQAVTADQIHAWPEVWTKTNGWVRFEPTNPDNRTDDVPRVAPAISESDPPESVNAPDLDEPLLLPSDDDASGNGRPSFWWLLVLAPVLYLVAIGSRKRWRSSRRRREADTSQRLVGAWLELRDRLHRLGVPIEPSTSVADLSEDLVEIDLRDAAEPVIKLAPLVDLALYSGGLATTEHADEAWSLSDQALKAAKSETPARTRVLAWLKP